MGRIIRFFLWNIKNIPNHQPGLLIDSSTEYFNMASALPCQVQGHHNQANQGTLRHGIGPDRA